MLLSILPAITFALTILFSLFCYRESKYYDKIVKKIEDDQKKLEITLKEMDEELKVKLKLIDEELKVKLKLIDDESKITDKMIRDIFDSYKK